MRGSAGSTLVEFLLVAILVFIPLTLATMQFALLGIAKNTLAYATFRAARAAALDSADRSVFTREMARGLVPLHVNAADLTASGPWQATLAVAYASALRDASSPALLRLEFDNPTPAAFSDFAVAGTAGNVISNEYINIDPRVGSASRQSRADANVLKATVDYCYRLIVPVAAQLIASVATRILSDPWQRNCLQNLRLPIRARSMVHMHTDIDRRRMGG
ncbi:MAG: TadE/TadG family type IV pilus assembly protein [Steroidobacteraceae bacterium]